MILENKLRSWNAKIIELNKTISHIGSDQLFV